MKDVKQSAGLTKFKGNINFKNLCGLSWNCDSINKIIKYCSPGNWWDKILVESLIN